MARRISVLLLLFAGAANAVTLTTVSQIIYRADGTTARGTVSIEWQSFDTAAGEHVPAGTKEVRLTTAGLLSVGLAPNVGASPTGTRYTVTYKLALGESRRVSWTVPTSTPVTVTSIESTTLVGPSSVVAMSQISATTCGVVFGGGGVLAQDATNLCWIDATNRLGIGTAAPGYNLDILGNQRVYNTGGNTQLVLRANASQNTQLLPVYNAANALVAGFEADGTIATYNGSAQRLAVLGANIGFAAGPCLFWKSGAHYDTGTQDTGICRNAAGLMEVNNGTPGVLRDVTLRNLTISGTCTGACGSGTGGVYYSLLYASSLTFNSANGNNQVVTLTGNVSSATVTATAGQQMLIMVCQDAAGGYTFATPSNTSGWIAPSLDANRCTNYFGVVDITPTLRIKFISVTDGAAGSQITLFDPSGGGYVNLEPNGATTSYTFKYPPNAGTVDYVLRTNGAGATSWVVNGGGSVLTPWDQTRLWVKDDFPPLGTASGTIGELRWGTNCGSLLSQNSSASHPGIFRFNNTGASCLARPDDATSTNWVSDLNTLLSGGSWEMLAALRYPTLDGAGTERVCMSTGDTEGVDEICATFDQATNTSIRLQTCAGSTCSYATNSGAIVVAANTFYQVRVYSTVAGTVNLEVKAGASTQTASTTSNVTAARLSPYIYITTSGHQVDMDYFSFNLIGTTRF